MKTIAIACALALAVLLPLSSCIGPKVDRAALFTPARDAWPDVRSDLELGLEDGREDGELSQEAAGVLRAQADDLGKALEATDRSALRKVPWPALRPWSSRGIDVRLERGEIGPGVATSFREHLANFDQILQRLRGPSL